MKQCPKCKKPMTLYQLLGGHTRWECIECHYEGEIE